MRKTVKMWILMLIATLFSAIFAVTALASEDVATVVYPDGTEATYAVGETILPLSAEGGLYHGKGNTLFKDDAASGWSFTVEGESEPLTGLTVTAELAGKRIFASGFDKVYYTSEERVASGTVTVYHLKNDLNRYFSSANTGDRGDGTNVGANSYLVLREKTTEKVIVTLYEDVSYASIEMNWKVASNAFDGRPCYLDLNGHSVTTAQSSYIDLMGIFIYIYSSREGAHWYQPNSGKGICRPNDNGTLYLGDDGSGAYCDNISFHVRQVIFDAYGAGAHILGGRYYQTAPSDYGGLVEIGRRLKAMQNASFYVYPGQTLLTDTTGPDGSLVGTGSVAIKNCTFYAQEETATLISTKASAPKFSGCNFVNVRMDVTAGTGATLSYTAGNYTNLPPRYNVGKAGTSVFAVKEAVAKEVALTLADGVAATASLYYQTAAVSGGVTVAYPDGASQLRLIGETLSFRYAAPAYTENGVLYAKTAETHTFTLADGTPIGNDLAKEALIGKTVYAASNATYAPAFFSVAVNGAMTYHTDGSTYADALTAYLAEMENGATVTLYSDVTLSPLRVAGKRCENKNEAEGATFALDLNGHTVTFTGSGVALRVLAPGFYLYSSVEGGRILAPAHALFVTDKDDYKWIGGAAYGAGSAEYLADDMQAPIQPYGFLTLGERTADTAQFGENLRVICASVNRELLYGGAALLGGTYIQSENIAAPCFVYLSHTEQNLLAITRVERVTVVLRSSATALMYYRSAADIRFADCRFLSTDAVAPLLSAENTALPSDPVFDGCDFYNILPARGIGRRTITYTDCAFGFSASVPTEDLDPTQAVAYLVPADAARYISVEGVSYTLDHTLRLSDHPLVTVQYPDGTRHTYAVGESIAQYLMADTYRDGKALYKLVGEGWTYSLSGTPIEGNTVPAEAAGKTLYATGYEYKKVYYTSLEQTAQGSALVYHLISDLDIYLSVQNRGDRGDGTNTGAFHYTELRKPTTTKVTITLYEDFIFGSLNPTWYENENRYTGRPVYLDLNGHTVSVQQSAEVLIMGMNLYIYSTVAGAEWHHENAAKMFRVDNDAKLSLGSSSTTAAYKDNITFFGKSLFRSLYGSGAYIYGGIFRQSAPATVFIEISRRVYAIENATFYLCDGSTALFGDTEVADYSSVAKGTQAIKGCAFHASSPVFRIYAIETGKATPTLEDCTLDGILDGTVGGEAEIVFPDGSRQAFALGESITPPSAVKVYTDASGVLYALAKEVWYLTDAQGAALSSLTVGNDMLGKTYTLVENHSYSKVFYTVEVGASIEYNINKDTHALDLMLLCASLPVGAHITLYEDITVDALRVINAAGQSKTDIEYAAQSLDLNGRTLTVSGSGTVAIDVCVYRFCIYSSRAGAEILAPGYTLAKTSAYTYTVAGGGSLVVQGGLLLGESEEGASLYGKNLTVSCRGVLRGSDGGSVSLVGVTLLQSENDGHTPFFCVGNNGFSEVRDVTFVLTGRTELFLYEKDGAVTFEGCRFINTATEGILLFKQSGAGSGAPTFSACDFFNVYPSTRVGVSIVRFESCAFGFVGTPETDIEGGEAMLSAIPSRTILVNGHPYILSYTLTKRSGEGCTVVYPGGSSHFFFVGATILPSIRSELYTGNDGIAYVRVGDGWKFLLDGTELSDLTVTEEMIGKTVHAIGYERVYFTVELDGALTSYTNASTYAADFKAYLNQIEQGATVRMYADASVANLVIRGKRLPNASDMDSAVYTLDLNGYTLTFTGSGTAMDIQAAHFYLYSSLPGGRIVAENQALFYTNNDDYKWINGAAVNVGTTAYKNSAETAIKPVATAYIGELAPGATVYGKNLTVVCASVNAEMYGTGVYFRGGTFVQSASSAAEYFLLLSRTGSAGAHIKGVENTTFVTVKSSTAFLNYNASGAVNFAGCRFICTAGAVAPLFTERASIASAPAFRECFFYDALPAISVGLREIRYTDCAFGFSGALPTEDMDARSDTVAFFAPVRAQEISVQDTAYTFNYTPVVSEAGFCTVYYPNGTHAIFYVGEIITPFTEQSTFFSEGRLFADLGAGWQYTLDGSALSDLTVTADMANRSVYATGYEHVYFYVEVNGTYTYYTSGETYAADLRTYLGAMDAGARIVLCEDVTLPSLYILGKRLENRDIVTNAEYRFDLNGKTLTFSGSGTAMTVRAAKFYLYSSVEGGKILCEKHVFVISDNDDYKWIDGAAVSSSSTAYKNATAVSPIKPSAIVVIGEADIGASQYGDHLTVVCAQVNETLYGTGVAFRGGRFLQSEVSTAAYFFYLSRTPKDNDQCTVSGTTFVLSNPATAFVSGNFSDTAGVLDCSFIGTAGTTAFFHHGMSATPRLTFTDCAFYDAILPAMLGTHAVTYTSCAFGYSGFITVMGDLRIAHTAEKVYAEGYALDCRIFTDVSEVCTVLWGDLVSEYWMLGTTPYCMPSLLDRVQERADGSAYLMVGAVLNGADMGRITESMLGTRKAVPVSYMTVLPIAFTYADAAGNLNYALIPDGASAAALGELFHATFDTCAGAYTIKLHADILLSKGIGWGPIGTSGDVQEYKSLQNGSVTLDLNGFTLTVAENCEAINASNANSTLYPKVGHGIFAFEINTSSTFTLTSSRAGGKINNLSSSALFVVGEQANITLVIEGENLAIESNGVIFYSFETHTSKMAQLRVNGGTYVYNGADVAIAWVGAADISNAEIYLTAEAISIFGAHYWKRSTDYKVTDTLMHCASASTRLFSFLSSSMKETSATMADDVTHGLMLTDCICLGFSLPNEIGNVSSLIYDGVALADASALLALYGGTAPEGTSLAFLERCVLSTTHRLYAYLSDAKIGTVDWGFGLPTEKWKLGEVATRSSAVIDGIFGYVFLPTPVDAQAVKGDCRMASLRPGMIRMSLTLQGTIGLNLFLAESLGATSVTVAGVTYTLADMETAGGFYTFVASVAPNRAHIPVTIEIPLGAYTHTVPVSIEQYAAAVLRTDAYADVHDLTYAMVEHVEAQTGTRFALCEAPVGYRRAEPTPHAHANMEDGLLDSIAFLPDGTISIALRGQVGTSVRLTLASGRSEYRVMTAGVVIFDEIYINEFFGDMTVRASKDGKTETYTYSLENYLYYQTDPALIAKVELLYNYTYYAHLYVDTLAGVRVDADSDHICDLCERSRSAHTDADADGLCDHCGGAPDWSVGLVFAENADGTYTLTDIGDCADAILRVPATYLGKPVSAIGEGALAGASVRSVLLPDSIRQIGAGAFADCAALEILTVGRGLSSIGEGAFADCGALSTVYYNGRAAGWRAVEGNTALATAAVFYYSEYRPVTDGYFWCYGADGEIFVYCKDLDRDHLCDDCGETLTVCLDADGNHLCDICGTVLSACADDSRDHLCDICGAVLSACADTDRDHLCDVCGTALSACVNGDADHFCDTCGQRITPCTDNNRDHICEICGEASGACTDANGNHFCDICDVAVSLCKDENGDHLCDVCLRRLSRHADTDSDHLCDLCENAVTACADSDGDHLCDLCAKDFGDCADTDGDHLCDFCGEAVSAHADGDEDHLCDLCGEMLAHVDQNGDHVCEICGTAVDCADGDKDHLCDLCGEKITSCKDLDYDHLCDTCGAVLSDHAENNGDHLCDVCALRLSDCEDADGDHLCDGCTATLSFCRDDGNARCVLCGRLLASEGLRYRLKRDGTYAVIGLGDCKDLYVYIPKYYNGIAVTEIAGAAFAARREIIGVSIPDSVEEIGLAAFAGCVNLYELRVGNGVREIPFAAFSLCTSLRSVTLGDGVEVIGLAAFADCMSLESVRFGSGLRLIQLGAFAGCARLETIALPEGLETIGLGAFAGCKQMKRVFLPESTVRIGHAAFDRQTALESICYAGDAAGFDAISVADKNVPMLNADLYFYTETQPAGQGRFWYYDAGGNVVTETLCPVHTDENHNLCCDFCAERIACEHALDAIGSCLFCNYYACITHKDYNRDLGCDLCGAKVACTAHADTDRSGRCDFCGESFTCTAHADVNEDGFCDTCSVLVRDVNFAWESETVTFEMSNHSDNGALTSRTHSFMAGDVILTDAATAEAIRARNAAAYEATGVSVNYRYLPEFDDTYAWARNYERIAVMQDRGSYADIYCNFGYDMLGASLLGCFANLQTELQENYFDFAVNKFYAETVGDGDGYMYEYMRSLAFDEDRMYLLASDYFIDLVRAFYCIPTNASMLEAVGAHDVLGLGRENTVQDLADAVASGNWTYETILRYSALFGDADASSDAVGLALAEDPLSAAGLLYTSSVSIFGDADEADNEPLYVLADSLSNLMRAKGVLSVEENGLAAVRERFASSGALFGGVVMLGNLEASAYRNMSDGVLILPVPVHVPGVEYATRIHDTGRIGAISVKTDKFGPCSALLNYQSTHSGAVLASYFERDLVVGALAASDALRDANLSILSLMRESVGGQREQAMDNSAAILAVHMDAISPAGEVSYGALRWQDILAAEHYDSTYVRSYYRMLRDAKKRIMHYIYLDGVTSLPR